jgi:hypothetical protein
MASREYAVWKKNNPTGRVRKTGNISAGDLSYVIANS